MSIEREIRKQQEETLFDNILSREFFINGKTDALGSYLEMTSLRLKSGMTADEIDAVTKRAQEAYKAYNL